MKKMVCKKKLPKRGAKKRVSEDEVKESTQVCSKRRLSNNNSDKQIQKDNYLSSPQSPSSQSRPQLGDTPTPVFDTSLHMKFVSHELKRGVSVDGELKCASVTGVTEHRKSPPSQSVIPSLRGFEDLTFSEDSSDSLVQVLADKSAPPSQNEGNVGPANNSEESRNEVHEKVPSKVNNAGPSNINKNGPPGYYSLDTTQMVEAMGDGDLFEADSLGPVSQGYKVKPQHVGLLTSIISMHGDIGSNCSMLSVEFRSNYLDHVCDIVQDLKNTNLKSITNKQLERMMNMVNDLEKVRVDVGWLKKRLDEISEAKTDFPKLRQSSDLKQLHTEKLTKVENIKEQLDEYNSAILDLQKKVKSAETALSVAETELSETGNLISGISVKVRRIFRLESLGDDLV